MASASGSERKITGSSSRSTRGAGRHGDLAATPETPRAPLIRNSSSLYGTPGGNFRTEDEYVVIEVGSRFLRGGFPGESSPRCTLSFDPDSQRRVGDYRPWDPVFSQTRRKRRKGQSWGQEHELYRLNLSDPKLGELDLGLVGDKFERAIREAYTRHFLLDPKPRRVLLALPPRMPHPLISTVLSVLFENCHAPSVTLLSSPVVAAVGAGLRSALVVDVGWAETVVTAVCEYREVGEKRSIRAGKLLSEEMAKLLNAAIEEAIPTGSPKPEVSFEEADEVLTRVAWCKMRPKSNRNTMYFPAREAPVLEEFEDAPETPDPTITIPFAKNTPPTEVTIPLTDLATPAERALFAPEKALGDFDDEELPLHHLIHRALLALPIDVRRLCMSRIVITGGTSHLPGLKTRILSEVEALVQQRGWDPVKSYGSASARHDQILRQKREALNAYRDSTTPSPSWKLSENLNPITAAAPAPLPASLQTPSEDAIDIKLAHAARRNGPPPASQVGGAIRGVETLGVWAGASLVAQMRIRGIVEIERDRFLKEGLFGASRDKEVSVVPQRQSVGPAVINNAKAGERGSWTLGVWA